jgi:tetratricopeptide (TPR) repeat protein
MRYSLCLLLLVCSVGVWAQSSSPSPAKDSQPASSQPQDSTASSSDAPVLSHKPDLSPPRSDRVNADTLEDGASSSKDTQIDLSPPAGDAKAHPNSGEALEDEGSGDVKEFHPWDPHKSAKDVEVGDFYFRRKNYKAAEDRYREALTYKDNDAIATYRLAVCLEKMGRPEEAREEFESYLQILPHGPQAEDSHKAIARIEASSGAAKAGK